MVKAFLWQYIIGPIVADAQNVERIEKFGVAAERGYNLVNEIVWGVLLVALVYGLVRLVKQWGIGDTPRFLYAVTPWIAAGAVLRVFEDAGFVTYPWSIPFITPLIFAVVLAAIIGVIGVGHVLEEKGVVQSYASVTGWSGAVVAGAAFLVLWSQFSLNGVVFGLILALAIFLFSIGDQVLRHTAHLAPSLTTVVSRWRSNTARIAIFGHVLDATGTAIAFGKGATVLGLAALGYGEKHPVVEWLITNLGSGYWFIPVKYLIILGVLYFFDEEFREDEPVLFNMLLVAVIAVGLGPGIRDLVRVGFGV